MDKGEPTIYSDINKSLMNFRLKNYNVQ